MQNNQTNDSSKSCKIKNSNLSKVSLLLTIISLNCFLTAQILRIESIGQVLIYISLTISFIAMIICIINLFRKNIKKKLSNILLVINGIYVGFFLVIVLVIALLSPVK